LITTFTSGLTTGQDERRNTGQGEEKADAGSKNKSQQSEPHGNPLKYRPRFDFYSCRVCMTAGFILQHEP